MGSSSGQLAQEDALLVLRSQEGRAWLVCTASTVPVACSFAPCLRVI